MPQTKITYPVATIASIVQVAIKQCYGLDWNPRVVRQAKKLAVGSLKHIDYAVPCFELTRQVDEPTLQIVDRLVIEVRSLLAQDVRLSEALKVEAVGGFVNFELSYDYLTEVVGMAADWFVRPEFLEPKHHNTFISIEPHLVSRAPRQEVTNVAYAYIDALHTLLKYSMDGHFLLSDFSYETTQHISRTRGFKAGKKENGLYIHNHELLSHESTRGEIEKLRKRWTRLHTPQKTKAHWPYITHAESEMTTSVHAYLEDLPQTKSGEGIIKDEANKAVYFIKTDKAIPLRSANGLLYRTAFILYLVNEQLMASSHDAHIVVLSPQRLHSFIYEFSLLLVDQSRKIICFDPYVSRADLLQIKQAIPSLPTHFKKLRRVLTEVNTKSLNSSSMLRSDVLSLVDLPGELCSFVARNQLPAVFDALGDSVSVSGRIGSKHFVKVTANQ